MTDKGDFFVLADLDIYIFEDILLASVIFKGKICRL